MRKRSSARTVATEREDEGTRPHDEWEQDVKALANKVMKVVAGYAASDAIAAMAVATKHILDKRRD
jgi:hypothetical protein